MPPRPNHKRPRRRDLGKHDLPGSSDEEEAEAPPRKKVALAGHLDVPNFEAALKRVKERLDDANNRSEEQARQLAATAAAHGKLQDSWDELRSELDKLNGEYNQTREKCTTRETEDIQGYTHSQYADDVKEELRKLNGQIQKLTRENEDVRGQLADTVGQLQTARVDARKQAAALQDSITELTAALNTNTKNLVSESNARRDLEEALGKAKADLRHMRLDNTAYRDNWPATTKSLLSFEPKKRSPVKLGTTRTDPRQVCGLLGVDLAGIPDDDWDLVANVLDNGTKALLPKQEAWTLVPRTKSVIHGTVELQCLATLAVIMSGAGPGPRHDAVASLCTCVMRCGVTTTTNFGLVNLVLQRLLGPSTAGESAFLATVLACCVGTTEYVEQIANIIAGRAETEQVEHRPFDDFAVHISALGLRIEEMRTYCATAGIVWASIGVGLLPGRDKFVVIEFGPRQIHILDESSGFPRLPRLSGYADYVFQFLDGRTVRVDANKAQAKIRL